jgi:hypothetical protein
VQIARVLAGRDIKVDVSVLLGPAERPAVSVASVVVTPGSPVVVDALTRFGVQPLTLSMVEVVPMTSYLPTVVSVSPEVDVAAVELLHAPCPGYRITLRDLGSKAVANVHLQSYRGDEKALSALKRGDQGRPLMKPGDSYTFELHLTSDAANDSITPGTWTPRPIDLIEFDSVRWEDGTYEGTPLFPGAEAAIDTDSGRRLQLRRIIDALRTALAASSPGRDLLIAARDRIDRLPDAEPDPLAAARLAMRATKRSVRADLTGAASRSTQPTMPEGF